MSDNLFEILFVILAIFVLGILMFTKEFHTRPEDFYSLPAWLQLLLVISKQNEAAA